MFQQKIILRLNEVELMCVLKDQMNEFFVLNIICNKKFNPRKKNMLVNFFQKRVLTSENVR